MTVTMVMLPGQGSQHPRMAWGLYGSEPRFTAALDEVLAAFDDGDALRGDWLSDDPRVPLDHVTRSQPLLFALDYALGRTLMEYGVRPWVMLGHSVGEMAAAVLAGVFTLRDGARLLQERVRLLAEAPPGGMLAVSAAAAALDGLLTDEVVVAAVNAPRQTILAGPSGPLARVEERLREDGFITAPVPALTAFHSPSLQAVASAAVDGFATTPVRAPGIPLRSCYTAEPLTAETAADPGYWAAHPVRPVLFWPALDAILSSRDDVVCVEAGPGQGLSTVARRHRAMRAGRGEVVPLLPARPGGPGADRAAFDAALARLARLTGDAPPERPAGAAPPERLPGHAPPERLPGHARGDEAYRDLDGQRPAPTA
ncbi:acyltransferase domain-containing protein [Nonomuraea sp. 3-1Str]|uniref:acyltransferase domain-containing protein n=1 Tax=Nonomuraea sp. 3-1Str TaxID=2929801 RepID=UPI002864AEF1|nr:acyltransferase domain-containing protein [Nonomuraea sp. 3-1Str]MDR8411815.1 acyltransferase domain-containing protein [Nonomuraea sp. 3-1Str]